MRKLRGLLFAAVSCLAGFLCITALASAQDVLPGVDLFVTPPSSGSYMDFASNPIPADFFGPGSDPFDGIISLQGDPLQTTPPGILGPTDTIVKRNDTAALPVCGSTDMVDIEIVALSLTSVAPITVTFNGGMNPEQWDVKVCLSGAAAQDTGTMIIVKECDAGGSFTANLPVLPKFTFTQVDPPNSQQELDFGLFALPSIPLVTSDGHWLYSDPGFNILTTTGGNVDHDCNSGTGDVAFGSSSNFFAGLQGIPCDCSNNPSNHNIVLTYLENPLNVAGHGVLPPIQPDNIPTLSEWGMLVLALLLLAIGTAALVRKRRAPATA